MKIINKNNIKAILNGVIILSILVIFIFSYMIYDEFSSAKKSCKDINGNYSFDGMKHLCNEKQIFRYNDGSWDFKRITYMDMQNWNITYP